MVLESDPNPDRGEVELDGSKMDDAYVGGGASGTNVEQEQEKLSQEIEVTDVAIRYLP